MPKPRSSVKLAHYRAFNRLQVKGALPPPELRLTAGQWVRTVRSRLGLSQRDLARRSGVSQGQIALIEKGRLEPHLATVRRLFDAMLCDLIILPAPRKRIAELRYELWDDAARAQIALFVVRARKVGQDDAVGG